MIHSPSCRMSLERLEAIRQDNYIGAGGKEYSACEVDSMIWQKRQRKADIAESDYIDALQNASTPAIRVVVMPPYPRKPELTFWERLNITFRQEQADRGYI